MINLFSNNRPSVAPEVVFVIEIRIYSIARIGVNGIAPNTPSITLGSRPRGMHIYLTSSPSPPLAIVKDYLVVIARPLVPLC